MDWSLLAFVGLNFLAALSGAIFPPGAWYEALNKPSWQPPNWAFPTVWAVLYAANAVAGWLVWREAGFAGAGAMALSVYAISLLLNAAWSAIFFGMKRMGLATFEAVLLWLSVALQIALFLPISQLAGVISLPYLAWVTVAIALSGTVWRLNPDARRGVATGS